MKRHTHTHPDKRINSQPCLGTPPRGYVLLDHVSRSFTRETHMHGIVTIGSSERDSERERERKGGRGRRTAALSLGRYLSTLGSVRRSLSIEPSKEAPFSCTACTHALTHKTHSRYTRGREQGRVCKGRHSLPLTKTGRPCVYIHSQHVAMTTHACPPSTHCSASPTPHHHNTTRFPPSTQTACNLQQVHAPTKRSRRFESPRTLYSLPRFKPPTTRH